jgi:hypothetical protein
LIVWNECRSGFGPATNLGFHTGLHRSEFWACVGT